MVHVGNDLRCDAQGARTVGLKTIWLCSGPEQPAFEADRTIRHLESLFVLRSCAAMDS